MPQKKLTETIQSATDTHFMLKTFWSDVGLYIVYTKDIEESRKWLKCGTGTVFYLILFSQIRKLVWEYTTKVCILYTNMMFLVVNLQRTVIMPTRVSQVQWKLQCCFKILRELSSLSMNRCFIGLLDHRSLAETSEPGCMIQYMNG